MKKNHKKLSLKVETLHGLNGGTQSYSGRATCLCETLECQSHHICATVNVYTCDCA